MGHLSGGGGRAPRDAEVKAGHCMSQVRKRPSQLLEEATTEDGGNGSSEPLGVSLLAKPAPRH